MNTMERMPGVSVRRPPASLVFTGLALFLVAGALISLCLGQYRFLSPLQVMEALFSASDEPDPIRTAVLHLRVPRLLLALFVGANLALAGAMLQALFFNPMAEPYLVGVSSGAAFGAVVVIALGLGAALAGWLLPAAAFAGAMAAVSIVYGLARRHGKTPTFALLLSGIALSGILQAMTVFLLLRIDPFHTREILFWMMGDLAYRSWDAVLPLIPASILGWAGALVFARPLNLLAGGEPSAHALGLSIEPAKRWLLLLASLLAATSVAACGVIAFVGLLVPHCLRPLLGAHHARLLPGCILAGAALLIYADIAARLLLPGQEIPVGILTALLGSVFFLILLQRRSQPG